MLASHNLAHAQKLDYTNADAPPNGCPGRLLYCKWYRACCPPAPSTMPTRIGRRVSQYFKKKLHWFGTERDNWD